MFYCMVTQLLDCAIGKYGRRSMANAIEVQHLRRVYRTTTGIIRRKVKEVVAVDDISFDVRPGELFGLLGPNGAGKTTTVKMLTTLLIPTGGKASVLGYDVVKQSPALRTRIDFIFACDGGWDWRLSAEDNLACFATLYQVVPEVPETPFPYQ